jgi:hypothetical protein
MAEFLSLAQAVEADVRDSVAPRRSCFHGVEIQASACCTALARGERTGVAA